MIDLQPSPEQQQIIDSIGSYLADTLAYDRFRPNPAPVPNGDRARWPALGELGIFGLGLAEDQGGVGYALVEEVLVARELGRYLVSPAAIATMVAAHVAAQAGEGALGEAIRGGVLPVGAALAFTPDATGIAGEYHLVDADGADFALVWNGEGAGLAAAGDWSERRPVPSIDSTLLLERARLGAPALWIPAPELGRRALLLVSAYLAGIAEAAVTDSVDYAKVREQFGQPIGAFQAVKHRCADMLARASAAWNLTVFAALAELDGTGDAAFQGIAAKIIAADAAFRNGATNIQNHGGIGFTGEHFAHLFVKRAHVLDRMGGDTAVQKKRMLKATPPAFEVAA